MMSDMEKNVPFEEGIVCHKKKPDASYMSVYVSRAVIISKKTIENKTQYFFLYCQGQQG